MVSIIGSPIDASLATETNLEKKLKAKNIIRSYNEHPVFNALKAEILWLEGDNSNAKKIANEVIYVCDEDFPIVY